MKPFFKSESFVVGLAMFSMFFGAGNVIFPLAVGQFAGDKNLYAIMGLIITAVIMPFAGVIAMILFDGSYREFFGRLGKIPGLLVALTIISLLGPLGSTPRCIALSYSTLKSVFPDISLVAFSALSCAVIFLLTLKKSKLLHILGVYMTPLLLGSLVIIILIGLFTTPDIASVDHAKFSMFLHGLKEGYNTMDLLAAFFFSSAILTTLKNQNREGGKNYIALALQASVVGAILLALIYIGFSYIASFHGNSLNVSGKDELLTALTIKIAGSYAGLLVCVTVVMACLTTAMALIAVFADFIQKEILNEKVSYEITLAASLLLTFFVSTFEFTGISSFLGPVLEICYPALIVFTFLNIANRLKKFEPVKWPVCLAFVGSTLIYIV